MAFSRSENNPVTSTDRRANSFYAGRVGVGRSKSSRATYVIRSSRERTGRICPGFGFHVERLRGERQRLAPVSRRRAFAAGVGPEAAHEPKPPRRCLVGGRPFRGRRFTGGRRGRAKRTSPAQP